MSELAVRPSAQARRIVAILLVALATLFAMGVVLKSAAHWLFEDATTSTMKCLIVNDPHTGVRGVPNSNCRWKFYETALVDYHFNDCGFRTPQPCGPAPAGTYRIVLIGSSMNYGMHVDQAQTFAARMEPILSDRLRRPIDVFNESIHWGTPASWALRSDAMLAPHPDLILWAVTPYDIENGRLILPDVPGVQSELQAQLAGKSSGTLPRRVAIPHRTARMSRGPAQALLDRIEGRWRLEQVSFYKTGLMFQHYLYQSQSQYLSHALAEGSQVDYLRVPASPALQDNLAFFAQALRPVVARARAAKVPLVVTLLPSRAQAIMLSNRSWDKGYDPNQLGRLLRRIVQAEGARYIDMTPGLEAMPDAGEGYLPVDEHPTAAGHRMLATLLANALIRSGSISPKAEGVS